jgi:hypothetical protein
MERETSWAHVEAPEDGPSPWVPHVLSKVPVEVLTRLTYAVLDEREADGDLSFVLTAWPYFDVLGRVRHHRTTAVDVVVPSREWQALLEARRVPTVLRDRAARIGDAFAVLLRERSAEHLLDPTGPVVDVTADARDAARAAMYGALAPPLPDQVETAERKRPRHPSVDVPAEWEARA